MSLTRRLAAILAADVADYSRLIGSNDEGILAQLRLSGPRSSIPKPSNIMGE
jgi:hypothetical protein